MRQATGRGRTPRRSCSGGRRSFTLGGAAEMEATWISIIVPVLNEAQGISESLAALAPLRARGHELIVVDGGSIDRTAALAGGAAARVVSAPPAPAGQMTAGPALAPRQALVSLSAPTP